MGDNLSRSIAGLPYSTSNNQTFVVAFATFNLKKPRQKQFLQVQFQSQPVFKLHAHRRTLGNGLTIGVKMIVILRKARISSYICKH